MTRRWALAVAAAATSLALLPVLGSPSFAAAPTEELLEQIRENARGRVSVTREAATGQVGFLRVAPGGDLLPRDDAPALEKASRFLDAYAPVFGATPAQLVPAEVRRSQPGTTVVFEQRYRGVPVFGARLKVNLDDEGHLTAVNGYAAPGLDLAVDPRIRGGRAGELAVEAVRLDPPEGREAGGLARLEPAATELVVYPTGAIRGVPGPSVLAYRVEVAGPAGVREQVFLDARTGELVNRYSLVHQGLERRLYEGSLSTRVWAEGDPLPGRLTSAQESIVHSSGETYWLFANAFGRDSFDGVGGVMRGINNSDALVCPNAAWDGTSTHYCTGTGTDDVVAHEWAHAYTQYTSDLVYQYQPGALNESYSDIWGETVDQINGRADEDESDVVRPVGRCSTHTGAYVLTLHSPDWLTRGCLAGTAQYGPTPTSTGISAPVVAAVDSRGLTTGCNSYPEGALSGHIALVDRGSCPSTEKTEWAQAAGALAVAIANDAGGAWSPFGTAFTPITIPTVGIAQHDGAAIRTALAGGEPVEATLRRDTADRVDTHRWLMAEDATTFGGAVRDMWNPPCYGHPAKVSDREYWCGAGDNGGVHVNSGVPNRLFALLVDGASSGSTTVPALGLDKAVAIHYRAQTAYLTPTSDFVSHADALETACSDLVGEALVRLSTAPGTAEPADPVTAVDCDAVRAAIAEVELRRSPTQCGTGTVLDPGSPPGCGPGYTRTALWSESFEDGLEGWTADQVVVHPGGVGSVWEAAAGPAGRAGQVAYGPATGLGECTGGAGDGSSRDSITSPELVLPADATRMTLGFDHYVATEARRDGGNVGFSRDGGTTWTLVPDGAYVFNPPNDTLDASTNPLAGQRAFTGTDSGTQTGSWGRSLVDLQSAGARPGDRIRVRFDLGRDGCNGVLGWYVDNVDVALCVADVTIRGTHRPEPSAYGQGSSVDVTVTRDASTGTAPTGGTVSLRTPAGALVGSSALVGGLASVLLPAQFPVGASTLALTYTGTASFGSSAGEVAVTVRRAASRAQASASPNPVRHRRAFVATVRISGTGVSPSGPVRILRGTTVVARGTARLGTARIRVTRDLQVGRQRLVAVYIGSPTVLPSRDAFAVRVVR